MHPFSQSQPGHGIILEFVYLLIGLSVALATVPGEWSPEAMPAESLRVDPSGPKSALLRNVLAEERANYSQQADDRCFCLAPDEPTIRLVHLRWPAVLTH